MARLFFFGLKRTFVPMKYTISQQNPHLRYIQVKAVINDVEDGLINIQLPAWRPGRYELGNFAKNVRNFTVVDEKGEKLPFNKATKDRWEVLTLDSTEITISYEYFADTLDAGSTYTDDDVLYINPVNCLVYETKTTNEACTLTLNIPNNYTIACALPKEGKTLVAVNFDELADSPIIAASNLQHSSFNYNNTTHHIWINGDNTLDIDIFTKEVEQYTKEQVEIFNYFPTKDFHYLIHFLPYRHRHGVEHKNSTVIVHGPGNEFHLEENRNDLLAICSHELFHFWNIKRIRPAAMFPYDFSKENYSQLGYIYEGVTTYYGDYMLLRSKVLNFNQYSAEFSKDLQRHFSNAGRYNYSVAQSSFDTWLDGYAPGTPARKVSIYVEGMLAALILDVKIRELTQHKSSLDTIMKMLYERFYLNNIGYTEKDYKALIEEVCGVEMDWYFNDILKGTGNIELQLPNTFALLGLETIEKNTNVLYEGLFGFKTAVNNNELIVAYCEANSPADASGLALNDIIVSANGNDVNTAEELNAIISNSREEVLLHTKSLFSERKVKLSASHQTYFKQYSLAKVKNATKEQQEFFKMWSKQDF